APREGTEEPALVRPRALRELLGEGLEVAAADGQLAHLLGLPSDVLDLRVAVDHLDPERDVAQDDPIAGPVVLAMRLVVALDLVGRDADAAADLPVHELRLLELEADPVAVSFERQPLRLERRLEAVVVDAVALLHLVDVAVDVLGLDRDALLPDLLLEELVGDEGVEELLVGHVRRRALLAELPQLVG